MGGYWALLAGVVPPARLGPFVAHLEDPRAFKRPHRVPSLSADHPSYDPRGGYWKGAVWAPTTYMVLRGLTEVGRDALAHEIGRNHLDNVVAVFEKTGHRPRELRARVGRAGHAVEAQLRRAGRACRPSRCCWSTSSACAPTRRRGASLWDVRLTEAHGVRRYPLGPNVSIDLSLRRAPRARRSAARRGDRQRSRRARAPLGGRLARA